MRIGGIFWQTSFIIQTRAGKQMTSTILSHFSRFVRDARVRLHSVTDNDLLPTGLSVGDESLPNIFVRFSYMFRVRLGRHPGSSTGPHLANREVMLNVLAGSQSNYWLWDYQFLWYREYQLAMMVHLNLLPVAAQNIKYGEGRSTTCSGCVGDVERQEHCLSMCIGNM